MPSEYRISDRLSHYQPLVDLLAASHDDEVVLTFKEIAALIGRRTLPESAILRPTWWRSKQNPAVMLWTAIGWQARADRDHLRVIFTQTSDRTESREGIPHKRKRPPPRGGGLASSFCRSLSLRRVGGGD